MKKESKIRKRLSIVGVGRFGNLESGKCVVQKGVKNSVLAVCWE